MSWLARSIANTLRLEEEEEEEDEDGNNKNAVNPDSPGDTQTNQSSPPSGLDSPRGVKEDLSEISKTLTRNLWGVASFLAPPPSEKSNQSELDRASDPEASDEAVLEGIRSDFAEIGGRFKTGISKLSTNIPVSEITKFASNFLQFGSEEENYEIGNVAGVTEEVVAFARDIAMHPGTWLDFPLPDGDDFEDFDMSDAQQEHALAVERLAPRLASLRLELCPGYMSEGCFWKIYFVLLHPRLNKHDAELLSTPQILEARALFTEELPNQAATNQIEEQSGSSTTKGTAFAPHEESLSVPSSSHSDSAPPKVSANEISPVTTAVETETEKHPVQTSEIQVVDKSIIEEQPVNQTKFKYSDENSDDEGDDWIKEETSEAVGSSATTIPIGNDEDVSFSDLEDDDDDADVPTSYKKVTSSSDSSTKDSRDWVQLSTSSGESVKDVNCVGENHAGTEQVSSRNRERKESNDWLDIEEIM